MSLIRRRTIPKTLTVAQILEKWNLERTAANSKFVRRECAKHKARYVAASDAPSATKRFLLPDVERIEQKIFGAVL